MEQFKFWFANSREASYLRVFVAIVLSQAILDIQHAGSFDFTNWVRWIITGLVSFLPMLQRIANDEDSLS